MDYKIILDEFNDIYAVLWNHKRGLVKHNRAIKSLVLLSTLMTVTALVRQKSINELEKRIHKLENPENNDVEGEK